MEVTRQVLGELQDTPNGWADTWQFFVSNIGGTPNTKRYRAMSASGIPRKNDPHPDGIPGVRVTNVSAAHDQEDPDQVIVTVAFGGESESNIEGLQGTGIKAIEISTSTISVQTGRDRNGKLMVLRYEGPEIVIPGASGGVFSASTEDQVIRAVYSVSPVIGEFDIPITTITVTTEENRPSHIRSEQVATRVNSGAWSGIAPHRVLCLGIDSNQNQSGRYDWRYLFSVAPSAPDNNTWRLRAETIVFGEALRVNNVLGNGIELFEMYEPINFQSAFGFEIPS